MSSHVSLLTTSARWGGCRKPPSIFPCTLLHECVSLPLGRMPKGAVLGARSLRPLSQGNLADSLPSAGAPERGPQWRAERPVSPRQRRHLCCRLRRSETGVVTALCGLVCVSWRLTTLCHLCCHSTLLVKHLCITSTCLVVGLLFMAVEVTCSLYVLHTNPLSDTWFASIDSLSVPFTWSLTEHMVFTWMTSTLSIYQWLVLLGPRPGALSKPSIQRCLPTISCRSFRTLSLRSSPRRTPSDPLRQV